LPHAISASLPKIYFAEKGYDLETYPGPRTKGMAERCIRGLIDVLEGNYGGNIRKMPYVVNKEAFQGQNPANSGYFNVTDGCD
jgi:hypothetical protein